MGGPRYPRPRHPGKNQEHACNIYMYRCGTHPHACVSCLLSDVVSAFGCKDAANVDLFCDSNLAFARLSINFLSFAPLELAGCTNSALAPLTTILSCYTRSLDPTWSMSPRRRSTWPRTSPRGTMQGTYFEPLSSSDVRQEQSFSVLFLLSAFDFTSSLLYFRISYYTLYLVCHILLIECKDIRL